MSDTSGKSDAAGRADRQDGAAVAGVFLSVLALIGTVVAIGLGVRANDGATRTVAVGSSVEVVLTEFAIEPAMISAPAGAVLAVRNDGAAVHNVYIDGTELRTPDIEPGGTAQLDVSSLPAGTYTVICEIPGHEPAGMRAMLHLGESGAATTEATAGGGMAMSAEVMDEIMAARTHAFPAATKGQGAQELPPTVLPDGTKQFELTASVFDWEVEPGKVVEAWGYNEQVPGPTLRVGVGDRIRIVLHNELPESTVIHSHGLRLPNSMDGVPDLTQPPVKPGETFVYEFVTREPQVAMYHSHHNATKQVTNGMLGALYVGDMPLPEGTPKPVIDAPMILNDAGTIGLTLNGKSFPATTPYEVKVGDWIKVDYMNEGLQVHPMHLHGMPQLVIAKDGYPRTPVYEDTVLVAPGERVSVLVHVDEPGIWAWHCHILSHAEREDGMFGMVTALIAT